MRISDWSSDVCSSDLLDRRRTWTPSPVPELAAVVREREHQRPALDMVARVRLPILAIAGVDDIALGLPVAGCSLRRSVADAPARAAADGLVDAPHERPVRVHDEDELGDERRIRSDEHTSELQSLMRISYAVFCL